jgi:hypothetical protein
MSGTLGRNLTLLALTLVVALPGAAGAHRPHTDGGPADRGCAPIFAGRTYVGATNVACRIARPVARGTLNGRAFRRWACAQPPRAFGHCHGRGIRRGAMVHWAVND